MKFVFNETGNVLDIKDLDTIGEIILESSFRGLGYSFFEYVAKHNEKLIENFVQEYAADFEMKPVPENIDYYYIYPDEFIPADTMTLKDALIKYVDSAQCVEDIEYLAECISEETEKPINTTKRALKAYLNNKATQAELENIVEKLKDEEYGFRFIPKD